MIGSLAQAASALASEVQALLTVPADLTLQPEVFVMPARTGSVGIGGFIGLNETPRGEVFARRLEARLTVRVKAASPAGLAAAEAQAGIDLLAASGPSGRARGILRLVRDGGAPPRTLSTADGLGAPAGRDIDYQVLFEHRRLPDTAEGMIDEIETDLAIVNLGPQATVAYASPAAGDPLPDFQVIDRPGAATPGAWAFDAPTGEIRQTAATTGGSDAVNGNKQGTYLVLRDSAAGGAAIADCVLTAEIRSEMRGGIGLVFRFTGPDSFGFVLLSEPARHRLLGRLDAGAGTLLDGGVQDQPVYTPTRWHRLRVLVQGDTVEVAMDGMPILAAGAAGLAPSGRVGLFARRNTDARFGRLRLTAL